MWKNINKTSWFLLLTTQDNNYEICITDYVTLWRAYYSETAFLSRLKESNDILTLTNENEYIQKGIKILSNPEQLKRHTIEKEDNGKTLFVSITIWFEYPFTFECRLSKGSDELFFQKITQTHLKTINDLRLSQTELRNLLKKKDKEIDEYIEEGGEIVLRHLKTVAFNEHQHMSKYRLFEENFGESDVPTCLLDKCVKLPVENVKQEPYVTEDSIASVSIKQELLTHDTEAATPCTSAPNICKQEVNNTELKPSINSPRKKIKKLNY